MSCVPFRRLPNLVFERALLSFPVLAATWPVSGFHRPGACRVFGPTCPEPSWRNLRTQKSSQARGGPLFALRLWWTSPGNEEHSHLVVRRGSGESETGRRAWEQIRRDPTTSVGSPASPRAFGLWNRSEHKTLAGCRPHMQSDGLAAKPRGARTCGTDCRTYLATSDRFSLCLSVPSICTVFRGPTYLSCLSPAPMTAIATTPGQPFSPSKISRDHSGIWFESMLP
jgi:hypothetical protein